MSAQQAELIFVEKTRPKQRPEKFVPLDQAFPEREADELSEFGAFCE
jgi:hypothetical protein